MNGGDAAWGAQLPAGLLLLSSWLPSPSRIDPSHPSRRHRHPSPHVVTAKRQGKGIVRTVAASPALMDGKDPLAGPNGARTARNRGNQGIPSKNLPLGSP